ncbi:MGMT family protein [Phocaeicola vulgatus]|uniref:MGMT family protein n=1 Tax=Phocaeicola vulgatus TaxID=821 RepID=UPI001C0344F0|nr:methylated-DNA--[protein]-cysteine S-methyltransferase [Phocaeicola vulgatus]MBT9849739.1 methylated-DNA--[protein]-cysteine S-methyltransferase [Phocaeicola vulgatus]
MDRAQFYKEVYSITKEIPYGNVFTYGKIAQLIGNPQYSRMVGQALSYAPKEEDLPCHRVVNSQGRLVLEKEGITFKRNGCVNMSKHLWDITGSLTSTIGISPTSATWQ